MQLRWIIRNGEKVLQQEVNRAHSTLAEDTIWQDIPLETNHEWSEVKEEKECKCKIGQLWELRYGAKGRIYNSWKGGIIIELENGLKYCVNKNGKCCEEFDHDFDLIRPWPEEQKKEPIKIEGYINVYPNHPPQDYHFSKEEADKWALKNRIACIKLVGTEGVE